MDLLMMFTQDCIGKVVVGNPELKAEKTIQHVPQPKEGIKIEQNITVKISDAQKVYYQFSWKLRV